MRTKLRIVAGSLRGRKLTCTVDPDLRPIPDRVREALFSILGDAVPERPFIDLFAGTGAVGLEAISRGANRVIFVERELRIAGEIHGHARAFGVEDRAAIQRADVYRWAERWLAPAEPVNIFLGPPFPDLKHRADDLVHVLATLQEKVGLGSVVVLQSERIFDPTVLPHPEEWDQREYGRNRLSIWVKEQPALPEAADESDDRA
jgi:16S rRNA (guanine(966)-N(2))-methyltransferase RsmD